jgi:hypothetical protein
VVAEEEEPGLLARQVLDLKQAMVGQVAPLQLAEHQQLTLVVVAVAQMDKLTEALGDLVAVAMVVGVITVDHGEQG